MKNLTASPDFVIRSPETAEEIAHYFRLNAETFRPDEDTVLVASRRRRFIENDPDFQMIQLRSAFYGKTYVGSYRIQERSLCVESSRLRIGCIGGVVTDQDYRHQGVATAMMQDAFAYAQNRQYSFLLLHGIPDYYQQHGFIDVIEDMPQHAIGSALIPDRPSEKCVVRVAELSDALLCLLCIWNIIVPRCVRLPLLVQLRVKFITSRTGLRTIYHCWLSIKMAHLRDICSCRREVNSMKLLRLWRTPGQPYLLCCITRILCMEENRASQTEVYWPLPLTGATYYLIADHLPMRSEIATYPDGGWMARMVSFSAVVQSLLPLWQDRWQKHHIEWMGVLVLVVDRGEVHS